MTGLESRAYTYWLDTLLPLASKNPPTRGFTLVDPAWVGSGPAPFKAFYADAGAPPSTTSKLLRVDASRGFVKGNVRWSQGRGAKGGKSGPVPKLDEKTVREILSLGHHKTAPVKTSDIAAIFPEATVKDVQDILAGRRYILADYNYKERYGNGGRLAPATCRELTDAFTRGASVSALATQYGVSEVKVVRVLARWLV